MAIFRARPCPRCRFYVGYCLAKSPRRFGELLVKSFCLNCDYQFPVRALVRGRKNSLHRQSTPRRAEAGETPRDSRPLLAWRPNYARELRAVGQDLEKRRFSRFNLECSDDSYVVWPTEQSAERGLKDAASSASPIPTHFEVASFVDRPAKIFLDRTVRVLLKPDDVSRLEHEGVQSRRRKTPADGRRLSHLLRTVGQEVYRRNQRLLAIAWQEPTISVVAETASGQREMNILRTDNLYDLWVRMYLQRSPKQG